MIQLHAKKNCLTVVAAELLTSGSVNVNTVSIEFSADWDGLSRVAVFASSTTAAAYSTDGVNWIQTTLPASADWRSVTYGDGKFVAVAGSSNNTIAAYSTDGINWTQGQPLPASANWYSVTYGNGKFVAVANNNNIAACSVSYRPLDDVLVALYNRIVALEP